MRRPPETALFGTAALSLMLAMAAVPSAQASPRFTVVNDTDTKVNVYIYKGDDPFCSFSEKLKSVSVGETDSYGCDGNGKGQCKVQFYAKGDEICKRDRNTCNKNAIKAKAATTITLTGTSGTYECAFN